MNCACAVVTNNSILRAGARHARERDASLFPRSPNWRTPSSREASRRRSDGSPIPPDASYPSIYPSVRPSVRPSDGGRSVDQLAERDRRDSRMPGLRPTGLPHVALSIPPAFLSRTSTFHFETSTPIRPRPYRTFAPTQKTGVVVNSWAATVEKSVAFVETSFPSPSFSLYPFMSSFLGQINLGQPVIRGLMYLNFRGTQLSRAEQSHGMHVPIIPATQPALRRDENVR